MSEPTFENPGEIQQQKPQTPKSTEQIITSSEQRLQRTISDRKQHFQES